VRLTNVIEIATRFLLSPANWSGLAFAMATIVLVALGWLSASWLGVAALAYGVGFACGGMWFGWPQLSGPAWEEIRFADDDDSREAAKRALVGIRRLVTSNPGRRLPAMVGAKLLKLCDDIELMLAQWDRAQGEWSVEDTFHARHIAVRYLPDALQSFWSIPAEFATTKPLANGLTAEAVLGQTVEELTGKVRELNDALAARDAQAFLDHSKFLSEKFGHTSRVDGAGPVLLK
jgi:hypothetical protein